MILLLRFLIKEKMKNDISHFTRKEVVKKEKHKRFHEEYVRLRFTPPQQAKKEDAEDAEI